MEKISYLKTHTRKGVYVCIYTYIHTHTCKASRCNEDAQNGRKTAVVHS